MDVGWLVVLRLNVPVNNFSVMSGRSHRFLGRELHHKLLYNQSTYSSDFTEPKSGFLSSTEPKLVDETRDGHQDLDSTSPDLDTSGTEGNEQNHQTTMMTQNEYRPDFLALCTVPVVLRKMVLEH